MPAPTVQVTFDVRKPATHLVQVTQRFPAAPEATRHFRMPAWIPGSYKIRDFGRHVQDLTARVAGAPAQVEQLGKDEWAVAGTANRAVELRFSVYARELTVDTSHVTADHAHLFPGTLALYDARSRGLPHKVALRLPTGWRAWSGLETAAQDGRLAAADDYDHLVDCPLECGPPAAYHVSAFDVRGVRHRHVVWQPPRGVDWARIDRDMAALCKEAVKVWGEVPYAHYTFLTHVAQEYGGGLEHRNSTVLGADPTHFQSDEKIQTRFLPLVAHEFFHAWNVKRVLPAAFQPYDLQRESYTGLLWLFEGFTSYYELPILHRAKVVDADAFGKMVGEDLEAYSKALGRKRTSVAQASRLAWSLLYQPFEHNVNRNVSYYAKGMWVALCLEAELRRRGVPGGLDAVMRHLWRKHGRTGVGVTEEAFPDVVEQATGLDLRAKLGHWIEGTQELPIDQALKTLGWDVRRERKDPKAKLGLGVEFKPSATTAAAVIARIWEDMPSFHVLQPDDELVAAEGYKWRPEQFRDQANARKAGDRVELAVFREGRLRTFKVPLAELPPDKIVVRPRKGNAAATKRRKAWLGEGKAPPKKGAKGKAKRAASKAKAGEATRLPPRGRHTRY
ncbi:MAG TPA: PDZ domain-containing protein [Candidatus Thermoplasmatota archaeon]|nr:PDZ domain-containing protein [Candidatus Thermoplasmatota archaeon]